MFRDTKAFSGFSVNNLQKAKKFYDQTLGLEVSKQYGLLELHIAGGRNILIYPKASRPQQRLPSLIFLQTILSRQQTTLLSVACVSRFTMKATSRQTKKVFVSAARVRRSRGLKTPPATCYLCLKRRNELGVKWARRHACAVEDVYHFMGAALNQIYQVFSALNHNRQFSYSLALYVSRPFFCNFMPPLFVVLSNSFCIKNGPSKPKYPNTVSAASSSIIESL